MALGAIQKVEARAASIRAAVGRGEMIRTILVSECDQDEMTRLPSLERLAKDSFPVAAGDRFMINQNWWFNQNVRTIVIGTHSRC